MSNYEDVYAPDLTEETESTLSGSEQFVMFDSVEGKRAELSTIADYIVANGEIDGSDIPTIVSTIEGNIGTLDTKVGDLTDLDTTDKTDIVSAINEVNGKAEDADEKADTVDEHVGDLSELDTEDKTSAVDAINEVLSKIPVMTKEVTGNPIVVDDALNADVVSLGVGLTPVQDLNGYDKPWAAGAGKNKFDESTLVQGNWNYEGPNTPNNVVTHGYLPIKGGITYMWSQTELVAGRYIRFYDANQEYDASGDVSQYNATNVTFNAPQWAVYMRVLWYNSASEITPDDIKALKPQIEEGTTATSWEPYSNICPITGHDSVTVGVTGKNLIQGTIYNSSFYSGTVGSDLKVDSGRATWTQNGNILSVTATANWFGVLFATDVLKAGTYHLHYNSSDTSLRCAVFETDKDLIVTRAIQTYGGNLVNVDVTVTDGKRIAIGICTSSAGTVTVSDLQVEYGNAFTSYESYHGQSKTVTLPHTVYGGKPNITTGNGTETLANIASYNGETINEPWWSSMDEYVQGTTPTTGAQVVYTLATPATLTTTPTDITLYNGDNTVSADGDMDMVYVRDIVKVIEKLEG